MRTNISKFTAVLLFLARGLVSCIDENKEIINESFYAKVENASQYTNVVEVKLMGFDRSVNKYVELTRFGWEDGGFTIELPKTLAQNFLHPLISGDWLFDLQMATVYGTPMTVIDLQPNVTISNKNVNIANVRFSGHDEKGYVAATSFSLEKIIDESNYTVAIFTYADSDVTICGNHVTRTDFPGDYSIERTNNYSVEWKKGWNVWYRSMSHTETKDGTSVITEQWSSTLVGKVKWYGYFLPLL